jgi:hypothetical protein
MYSLAGLRRYVHVEVDSLPSNAVGMQASK